MRIRSFLSPLAALLAASLIVEFGTMFGADAPAHAEQLKIVLPTPPNTFGVPHYIAIDKGWYKEQGLEIEEIQVQGDATAFRTLVSGDGDLTLVGPSTTMLGYLKGTKVKVFGSWQPRVDYQLISNKNKTAKIDKGLEGLTMAGSGGVSMLNHMIAMVMKKHGLDPSGMKNIGIGGHADRLAAVIAGKADITLVSTLIATRAGDQVNWLAPIAKELGGMGYVYLVAREESINNPERRGALKKLMKGSMKGARYAMADIDFAVTAVQKRMPETPVDVIRKVLTELIATNVWGTDGGIPDEVTDFTGKAYLEYKEIERLVTPQEILYKGIVDELNAELKDWKPKQGS
ncbi:MAG: ABC transporter substrate-binding protein [Alphaproteobacteria bacterium]|nr:ABC transporter substrate-binding protein [Alphaproteobacteria bacterium]